MHRCNQRLLSRITSVVVLVLGAIVPFIPAGAEALGFQQAYVRLDRMKASTTTGGTVCAQAASTATEAKVLVEFPTGYTVNSTNTNWTVTTTNLPAGSSAWPGISTATTVSGQIVTFPSTDLPNTTTLYCFNFAGTSTLTTTTAGTSQQASIQTQTSGSVLIDKTAIALANITDDQVQVSAVVPPSFIFVLGANADPFLTNLSPAAGNPGVISTGGVSVTVTTNAKGGWIGWVKDQYQGLHSATTGYTIPKGGTVNNAPFSLTGGTEGYVIDADLTNDASLGCTLDIDNEYDGADIYSGGTPDGNFQPFATCTGVSPATANGDVVTLIERATISAATPAGSDYVDTLTVVGAGNF